MHTVALWCALCLTAAAGGGDDVANERPPVSRAELETHWGIDCGATRVRLGDWLSRFRDPGAARPPVEALERLLPDLERCALLDRRAPVAGLSHRDLHAASRRLADALATGDGVGVEAALESVRDLLRE